MPATNFDAAEFERLVDAYGKAEADSAAWSCSDGSPYIFVSEAANVARAARRALVDFATKGEEWLPIADAPKDGTVILLYGECAGEIGGPDGSPSRVVGRYTGGRSDYPHYKWDVIGGDQYCVWCCPTHWCPLPAPPKDPDNG